MGTERSSILKAIYSGQSERGFETGKTYNIRTNCRLVNLEESRAIPCLCIYDADGTAWRPYENLEAALKEWKFKDVK